MSRAFTKEDGEHWADPSKRYSLPDRDDPMYDAAAAATLLEAARTGDTGSAEMATGYYWGDQRLHEYVRKIREHALATGDERLAHVASLFLGDK